MDEFFGLDRVSSHDENLELLMTVNDPIYLSIITGILSDAKIPYIVKERGSGGAVKIIAGFSRLGSDIFVLKTDIEGARALFEAPEGDSSDTDLPPQ